MFLAVLEVYSEFFGPATYDARHVDEMKGKLASSKAPIRFFKCSAGVKSLESHSKQSQPKFLIFEVASSDWTIKRIQMLPTFHPPALFLSFTLYSFTFRLQGGDLKVEVKGLDFPSLEKNLLEMVSNESEASE